MQDHEFTAALERAVARRGGDYRYPKQGDCGSGGYYVQSMTGTWMPSYSTPGGEATCIVGAALVEAGVELPNYREVRSAAKVLERYNLSTPVRIAARAAQIHQDHQKPWAEALAVYHKALTIAEGRQRGFYLSEFDYLSIYHEAAFQVTQVPPPVPNPLQVIDLDKIMESTNAMKKALSALAEAIPAPPAFPNALVDAKGGIVGEVSFNIDPSPELMSLLSGGLTVPLTKKEHALVA